MKKLVHVLVMVAVMTSAVPMAVATVVVTCTDMGNGIAAISYDWSGETIAVRGFSLDITVNNGATIESIFDYKVGESTAADPGYGIFIGSILIDGQGQVIDYGNPVANATDPDSPGQLGSSSIVTELGSLYDPDAVPSAAPLVSGTLFKIAIDWNNASMVDVDIALNTLRGGIIMEDPDYEPTVNLVGVTLVPEPTSLLLIALGTIILRKKL